MEWKKEIERGFQKRHVKEWREIALELLCVDVGLKPALLWDYPLTAKEKLVEMLKNAKMNSLLNNTLIVTEIDMDLIVRKNDVSSEVYLDLKHVKVVDVSPKLSKPLLIENEHVQKTFDIFKEFLSGEKNRFCLEENIFNPTTLFGLVLDYPVLYWYDMDDKDGNCLDYEPLRVYKVIGSLKSEYADKISKTTHTVFSFSVPEIVLGQVDKCANEWFDKIRKCEKWKCMFSDIHLEEETVTLPSVCL